MRRSLWFVAALLSMSRGAPSPASSHREAPFVTKNPKVDATDFYAFNSYETGRADFVTLIANYQPLQDSYGGPNYFSFDPDAIYEIHIDNNGDGNEDITFQFDFASALASAGAGLKLAVGPAGNQKQVAVPLVNIGSVTAADASAVNVLETYAIKIIRGDRRTGVAMPITKTAGAATFEKPLDNIGSKTFANYGQYANAHVFDITIPGCGTAGSKVFVGQRAESFAVNLGQVFDLLNLDLDPATPQANPLGSQDQGANVLSQKNVATIALEVPASCLNDAVDTIFGAWTSASVRQARVINPSATFTAPTREGGPWAQVSRLGNPLVNEVVIGLPDKDRFNGAEPANDAVFADYVTHPTLPEIFEIQFGGAGVAAPNNFPRADLVAVFLTGVTGLNATATAAEMLHLNTATAATPAANQNALGALPCFTRGASGATLNTTNAGCDAAGYPNGRRPGDDVVDIVLRVAMGYFAPTPDAGSGGLPLVDGAFLAPTSFATAFPYLNTPRPGAP